MGLFGSKKSAAQVSAPTVGLQYYQALLVQAGYPLHDENLEALIRQVGNMFLVKAGQFIASRDPAAADRFTRNLLYQPPATVAWAQSILDGLVKWNSEVAPYIQDLPERVTRILLETRSQGGFFSVPPQRSLQEFFEQ